MNIFDATTRATPHGYIGLFRCVHKASYREVCVDGRVKFFKDKKDAQIAADEALRNHLNTDLTGFGETLSSARIEAEKLFIKGKVIPIETSSQRAIIRDVEQRRERIGRRMEQR